MAALSPAVVGLQSTGSFERLAVAAWADNGLAIVMINPARV
ncbi:hypothetical protein [Mesorhizobium sp. M0959]